jgi:hypothetical protein
MRNTLNSNSNKNEGEIMFNDDSEYFETCKLKRNTQLMNELFIELSEFINQNYNVEMINCIYDLDGKTPRLNIVVNTTKQFLSMNDITSGFPIYNKDYQRQIAKKFTTLVKARRKKFSYSTSNLFIFFTDFENESQIKVNNEMIKHHRLELMNKYQSYQLWDIVGIFGSSTVFYFLDNDIEINKQNGISDSLKNEYFQLLKQYDEYNYFNIDNFNMYFDSKENLDKNYAGNLYYYFK